MERESGMLVGALGGIAAGGGGITVAVFAVRDALAYMAMPGELPLNRLLGMGAIAFASLIGTLAAAVVVASGASLVRRKRREP